MTHANYTTWNEYKTLGENIENARNEAIHLMGDEARKAWGKIDADEARYEEMYKTLMPEVGMGATEILYSDRRAKTIVEVITPNKIVVKENETKCLDYFGDRYEILDTINENMGADTYTRRKSGHWVMAGQPDKMGSVFLHIGKRYHSIDPSF